MSMYFEPALKHRFRRQVLRISRASGWFWDRLLDNRICAQCSVSLASRNVAAVFFSKWNKIILRDTGMKAYTLLGPVRPVVAVLVLAVLSDNLQVAAAIDDRPISAPVGTQSGLDAQVTQLIQQLGDEQYAARQRAQEQLGDLGMATFDALLEACRHEDVEIALRARYLIRSMPVRWTTDSDSTAVRNVLRHYDQTNHAERRNRMQQLARLENSQGIPAICRLMRFESDGLLSKQAALCAMHHTAPSDQQQKAALADLIRKHVGASKRPASVWLRTYAQTLVAPELAIVAWDQITQAELLTFAQFPQQTDRRLVRDLLRWQVDLLRRLERQEESLVVVRRTIDLLEGRREELFDFVDWLLDRKAWGVVDEVADRFPYEFYQRPKLVYRLAEARHLRGDHESALETAERALKMEPGKPDHHNLMAGYLTSRLLYDWAEAEYRYVLELTDREDSSHIEARFFLSDMLFDIQREFDAAEILTVAAETIEQNPRVLSQLPFRRTPSEVRGATYYYYAMHHARRGDYLEQQKRLRQAVAADPANPDFMIAMYRCPNPEPAWKADAMQRINAAKDRLRQQISLLEEEVRENPGDAAKRQGAIEALATEYNELAWLISNTEGDYAAAVRYSKKSLESRADNAAFLDTLARCHYANGDLKNAVKSQQRAAELAPYYQQIHRQLEAFQKELAESGRTHSD